MGDVPISYLQRLGPLISKVKICNQLQPDKSKLLDWNQAVNQLIFPPGWVGAAAVSFANKTKAP